MARRLIIATIMNPRGETGVQTHFNAFLRYLQDNSRAVDLVTPFDSPKALYYPLFGVRRLVHPVSHAMSVWWYRYWHYLLLKTALRKKLRGVSVIYAQCPLSAKAAIEARESEAQRVVMVAHFNASQADEFVGKGLISKDGAVYRNIRALEAAVFKRLDGVVYVSKFMKQEIERRNAEIALIPSAVIPNFVHTPIADMNKKITGDLISIGTLEPRKNHKYLLEIVAQLNALGCSVTLTLVGDGPEMAHLSQLAGRLKIAAQVTFVGFKLDAAKLIRGHKMYIHTALMESLPMVLIEAMSCGLVLAAVPVGGIPEVFEDGKQGIYLPPGDARAAAFCVAEVLRNRVRMEEMGAASLKRFETQFAAQVVGRRLIEFLDCDKAGLETCPSR